MLWRRCTRNRSWSNSDTIPEFA